MCVYICAHVYIYMCVWLCIYICVFIFICVFMYMYKLPRAPPPSPPRVCPTAQAPRSIHYGEHGVITLYVCVCVCVKERECVCMCVRARERESVRVCGVCEKERDTPRRSPRTRQRGPYTLKQTIFSQSGIKPSFFRTRFALVLAGIQQRVVKIEAVEKRRSASPLRSGVRWGRPRAAPPSPPRVCPTSLRDTGYESGYGYCLPPYGTAYRKALRPARTRLRTRIRICTAPGAIAGGGHRPRLPLLALAPNIYVYIYV